jgi:HK97 family phage major capsid protein
MLKLTQALKGWLVENMAVKADASDETFRKAAGEALAGEMDHDLFIKLTKDAKAEEADALSASFDKVAGNLEKLLAALTPKAEEKGKKKEEEEELDENGKPKKKPFPGAAPPFGKEDGKSTKPDGTKEVSTLTKMFMGNRSVEDDDRDVEVRVKEAAEQYSDTKSALRYPTHTKGGNTHMFAGRQVVDPFNSESGRGIDEPSQRDKAVVGAFGQFMIAAAKYGSKTMAWSRLPDHQKELVCYALQKMEWGGATNGESDVHDIDHKLLTPLQQKAIIDDAVSGGTEAVPIVFDDMIVSTPILYGEFFPLVNLVPLDKGRRIQGARAGIVSSEWGGIDDTAVTLFNTAAYVTAFDTTVYRWQGSISIGLDFLSDTPVDFAQFLTKQYGEVLMQNMDTVICVGNGTTQPEGIMVKAGTTSVAWGGTTTLGNYESLRFGVHKREHSAAMMKTAVFGGTDTSYQRAKAIPVGANDARRLNQVMNLPDYDGYSWMGRPYKINESLANTQVFYAILGRYRMYQRRGLTIRNSSEGDTLIRRNEMLMVAMARFGGQLERGAAAAVTTTAPA